MVLLKRAHNNSTDIAMMKSCLINSVFILIICDHFLFFDVDGFDNCDLLEKLVTLAINQI